MLLFRLVFQNPFSIAERHSADLDRLSRVAVPVFVRHQLEIANADQVIFSLARRLDGHVEKTRKLAIRFRPTSPYSALISTRHPFVPARRLSTAQGSCSSSCSMQGSLPPRRCRSRRDGLQRWRPRRFTISCYAPSLRALRRRPTRPLLVHPLLIAVTVGDWDAYVALGSTPLPGFEGWRRMGFAHFAY